MALRGVKPELVQKRLKALFYGPAGAGKTTMAISFPKVYLVDTEKGAENDQYVKIIQQSGGVVFRTSDFDELIKEVIALMTEKHEFKTLVIDPLTTLYNDLLDKSANIIKAQSKEKDATGTEFGRHYALANKKMTHLLSLLLRLDMNVIITSHSKNEYGPNLAVLGQTFDCYKKLDYLFDLVFEVQKRGKDRVGVIKKTRLESFGDGESFPFTYAEVAKRYGSDILEKEAVSIVLASDEQVEELNRLIELLKVQPDVVDKWLTKANAENVHEMSAEAIAKCISYLQDKIKGDN